MDLLGESCSKESIQDRIHEKISKGPNHPNGSIIINPEGGLITCDRYSLKLLPASHFLGG